MVRCKSILIAEDNVDIRETLEDVLMNEGYSVATAANGKEALHRLSQLQAPTLILLDLMMPVMSGWEFLDAQKKNAVIAANPVVVMSAVKATQSLEDPTPLKTAGNFSKPIAIDPLLDLVKELCEPADLVENNLNANAG